MLDHIFARYDAVLVLDTETTGISCRKDEIIELAVLKAGQDEAGLCELETMDEFVRLSEGRHLPDKIVELTGITERMLLDDGISKRQAAEMFSRMFGERTLIVAYNAQFDLCFLYYFLAQFGMADVLRGAKMLDALTVYKDRIRFPISSATPLTRTSSRRRTRTGPLTMRAPRSSCLPRWSKRSRIWSGT